MEISGSIRILQALSIQFRLFKLGFKSRFLFLHLSLLLLHLLLELLELLSCKLTFFLGLFNFFFRFSSFLFNKLILRSELSIQVSLNRLHLRNLSLGFLCLFGEDLLLLLILRLHILIGVTTLWCEHGGEANLSCWLIVEHDGEPIINSTVDDKT